MYLVTLQKVKMQETTGLQITGEFQTVVGIFIASKKRAVEQQKQNETDDLVALEVIWLLTTVYCKYESFTREQLRRTL